MENRIIAIGKVSDNLCMNILLRNRINPRQRPAKTIINRVKRNLPKSISHKSFQYLPNEVTSIRKATIKENIAPMVNMVCNRFVI